ncbi:MAG: HNH endonuclease signature motif containing protein [Terracidiphilus sp.]
MKYFKPKPEPILYPEGPGSREVCNLKTAEGKRIYDERHKEAWVRDGRRCGICGHLISFEFSTPDHISPRGMGGARRDDRVENLQASHFWCNNRKGSRRLAPTIHRDPPSRPREIDFSEWDSLPF